MWPLLSCVPLRRSALRNLSSPNRTPGSNRDTKAGERQMAEHRIPPESPNLPAIDGEVAVAA